MHKRQKIDRKQKRVFRRILFLSLIGSGLFLIVAGGTFWFVWNEKSKPLYISPIASLQFIKEGKTDRTMDQLKAALKTASIVYASIIKTEDSNYLVTLDTQSTVLISSQKNISAQIASLQYILTQLTMEGRQFKSLDLRFAKPVIVTK